MDRGNLEIQGRELNPKNGQYIDTERLGIAEGLITTSKLVRDLRSCLRKSWL